MTQFDRRQLLDVHSLEVGDRASTLSETSPLLTGSDFTLSEIATVTIAPVFRRIVGRDHDSIPLSDEALLDLNDPFARLILNKGYRPLTADELLDLLRAQFDEDRALVLQSFVVGEGGQVAWTEETASLNRSLRFVVTCRNALGDEIMMSLDDRPNQGTGLIQLLAWDPKKGAYNFFQRVGAKWFFVGDSYDAHEPDTRGRGPFDGHVNGSLVMKELREPWLHWGSMTEQIEASAFAPDNAITGHWLFQSRRGAEILEDLVVAGIDKWTAARFEKSLVNGELSRASDLLNQIVDPDTVNIVSSPQTYSEIDEGSFVRVPWDVFLNREFWTLSGLLQQGTISGVLKIPGDLYLEAIAELDQEHRDQRAGYAVSGDSFFALACPSAAYENLSVVRGLLDRGIISSRLLRALMAVDFCNPVQSSQRQRLAQHFPQTGKTGIGAGSVEDKILASMKAFANAHPASDEATIIQRLTISDEDVFTAQLSEEIAGYIGALKSRLISKAGVLDLLRLIGSRRKFFRSLKINEFPLAFPFSRQDDEPYLMMRPDASVVELSNQSGLMS